jgi:hypothetical protein
VLGTDVGGEQRGADHEPAGVAPALEVALGGGTGGFALGDAVGDGEDRYEVHQDHEPIDNPEQPHDSLLIATVSDRSFIAFSKRSWKRYNST